MTVKSCHEDSPVMSIKLLPKGLVSVQSTPDVCPKKCSNDWQSASDGPIRTSERGPNSRHKARVTGRFVDVPVFSTYR